MNATDRWGHTPLRDALRQGHAHVMGRLLEAGGSLRMEPSEVAHQMCLFAREGRPDPLLEMLKCGVDANVADYDGRTPLHVAAAEGHKAVVVALIGAKAGLGATDRWGNSAREDAERAGHNWGSSVWA